MMEGIDSVIANNAYRLSVTYLGSDENIPAKLLEMKKTGTGGFILLATELNHVHAETFLNLSAAHGGTGRLF